MNKNIVICCDGTGNKFGLHNTNIVNIAEVCVHDKQKGQIVYYNPGVGALNLPTDAWWAELQIQIFEEGFGSGLNKIVFDAYQFLMQHYESGDKVFLFGFSRGAYAVRALAGILYKFGLLREGTFNLVPYIFDMNSEYHKNEEIRKISVEFKKTFSVECKPHFIGVFDTVAALGSVYSRTIFSDDTLNPDVNYAYHALAIDEHRVPFKPFLWNEKTKTPFQTIEQVWFIGDHGDVGGGHTKKELSDIALKWMLQNGEEKGLQLKNDWQDKVHPNSLAMIHKSYTLFWGLLGLLHGKFGKMRRRIPEDSLIHVSVKERINDLPEYKPKLPQRFTFVGTKRFTK